jgi:hypothetical protein
MINGAHFLLYSKDADADRAFITSVLEFPSVDVGGGWLIFALPPSEIAVHPVEDDFSQMHADFPMLGVVLYLMCDDIEAEVKRLTAKKVVCGPIDTAPWGIKTAIKLPSGGYVGLYQPTHALAYDLKR